MNSGVDFAAGGIVLIDNKVLLVKNRLRKEYKEYYDSDEFLSDINQMKSLVERYLDLISALEKSYNDLKIYSEEELNS